MSRSLRRLLIAAAAGTLLAGAGQASPTVSDVRTVVLHSGVNAAPHIGPGGEDAVIVEAGHADSVIADGFNLGFLVLLRTGDGWRTVDAQRIVSAVSDSDFGGELVRAVPHAGDDWRRSISFARAKIDGAPAFIMIVGEREMRQASQAYSPVPARVLIYRLGRDPEIDQPHFILIDQRRTDRCYVNVWLAVHDSLGAPLPADYEGPMASEPCPRAARP